jgi:hypothetical protein
MDKNVIYIIYNLMSYIINYIYIIYIYIYAHTMNGSVIRKKEIMSFAVKWVELENIILKKMSQTQRTTCCTFFSHMYN